MNKKLQYNLYSKILIAVILWNIFSILCADKSALIFKSGFEDGVYLGKPYNDGGGTWYQDLQGSDESGYSWPVRFWNGSGAFQVLVDSSLQPEKYIKNEIISVTGHNGEPTRVMHSKIFQAAEGWTQDPYIMENLDEQGDLYVKYWLKYPENLPDLLGDGTDDDGWCVCFEFKTSGDYRIAAYVYIDKNRIPYWYAHGDNVAKDNFGSYKEYWFEENRILPVPENEWFLVEFYFHRSTGNDGRFWWAVNHNVIVDHYGPNKIEKDINRIMLFTVYAGKYPFEQWVDDVEIRDNFPDMPPRVVKPVSDYVVLKNSDETLIDLSDVFQDPDNDNSSIRKSVYSNSNPELVSLSLSDNILRIKYAENKTGTADIVISAVSGGITVFDEFSITVADERLTTGSKSAVTAGEINAPRNINTFGFPAKIYAEYIAPFKFKEKRISLKILTKDRNSSKLEYVWNKKICLYDKHALSKACKSGTSTETWLKEHPIKDLKCSLYIETFDSDSSYIDTKFRDSLIVPPVITSVLTVDGKNPSEGINGNSVLEIKGRYFGTKLPKIKLEYKDGRGKIKFVNLKVQHILKYPDSKGRSEKSCMEPSTGESIVFAEIPSKVKPGVYSLLLLNKIGIAPLADGGEVKLPVIVIK
jgi:hypothetical protein